MNVSEGRVWAEIYLDRLINNYKIVQKKAKKAEIMAAIKADAYGHGAIEVARMLESEGIHMFGVASVEEGVELREAGITSRILVLSPVLYAQIDTVLEYNLMPTVSEPHFFRVLERKLKSLKRSIRVHVEVDTGMTRTGIPYDRASLVMKRIHNSRFVKIEGLFSHFPVADADGSFTNRQIRDFIRLTNELKKYKIRPSYFHLANSSGMFKHDDAHLMLVRPGIALYGLTASPEINYARGLRPVMAIKSRVVNIRTVQQGTPISYGHTYITKKKSKIATISVGYGDGYPRSLSNKGGVLIRGRRAPIVGTICMDLMMIDVTGVKGVRIGDVVTLIGRDGGMEITAEECASKSGTIVYEITSGIGPRVARVFQYNGRCLSVRNLLGRWRYGY